MCFCYASRYFCLKLISYIHFCLPRALYLNIPLFILFVSLIALLGMLLVAYFGHCDPLLSGRVAKPDQVRYLQRRTHIYVMYHKPMKHVRVYLSTNINKCVQK